ncbi:cytidylate kinase [Candidatus Photodesmus blepharus]|uniref:Cytidylate kinase n=1 Tax=Candidatus Photodesmus blepharonis TaxID=1179155 RepID=A0A084CMA8_9GAMM|nr:(d)CMP kinase [Candidatus Photodesmus blepharus]KEY90937.1 cytidylate kinase [Candidatus Photodesmus blepharus]
MLFERTVITIDGPSGVGKGTLCTSLAIKLGFDLLDSGALYRVLALAAIQHKVLDERSFISLAMHLDVKFLFDEGLLKVIFEGIDVSQELRTEKIGVVASKIAVLPRVRQALLSRQRAFASRNALVADGRDMGTIVFPSAQFKFFLNASIKERAKRRVQQLKKRGLSVQFEGILKEMIKRDYRDSHRSVAPLIPAEDAFLLDSTFMSIDEVLEKALQYIRTKLN